MLWYSQIICIVESFEESSALSSSDWKHFLATVDWCAVGRFASMCKRNSPKQPKKSASNLNFQEIRFGIHAS